MRVSFAVIATLTLASTAAAETKKADMNDPNRMVCEKQAVEGSRIATKRVCMTAAEWKAKRLEERQAIEKSQVQRSGPAGN